MAVEEEEAEEKYYSSGAGVAEKKTATVVS